MRRFDFERKVGERSRHTPRPPCMTHARTRVILIARCHLGNPWLILWLSMTKRRIFKSYVFLFWRRRPWTVYASPLGFCFSLRFAGCGIKRDTLFAEGVIERGARVPWKMDGWNGARGKVLTDHFQMHWQFNCQREAFKALSEELNFHQPLPLPCRLPYQQQNWRSFGPMSLQRMGSLIWFGGTEVDFIV